MLALVVGYELEGSNGLNCEIHEKREKMYGEPFDEQH